MFKIVGKYWNADFDIIYKKNKIEITKKEQK